MSSEDRNAWIFKISIVPQSINRNDISAILVVFHRFYYKLFLWIWMRLWTYSRWWKLPKSTYHFFLSQQNFYCVLTNQLVLISVNDELCSPDNHERRNKRKKKKTKITLPYFFYYYFNWFEWLFFQHIIAEFVISRKVQTSSCGATTV